MATDLNVTLSGSDVSLSRTLQQVERSATRTERSLEQMRRGTEDTWAAIARAEQQLERDTEAITQRRHAAYDSVGKSAMVMGALVSAGVALATKAAMGWETAWTGVTKTVDGSAEEMAVLEGQLRGLARTLPHTHEEIAAVAEAAGQLGIKREDIAGFTKTMLDMGVSTNLTAEQAAVDFARLAEIMQMDDKYMSNLGSTAVALGNNFATTEGEIVALGLRLAGTGKQVGLTEADVFGLSAAMSSVGIEAEAGGSAMSQTMAMIQKDVESGGKRVAEFAAVAGMSAEQFATMWREDAAGALVAFTTGLGNLQASGGSALQTLEDLGIKGLRQVDTLLRLSGAGTTLADALDTANTAFGENNALQAEAARFYATTENQLKAAKNEFNDLAIDLGAVMLPVLVSVGEQFANVTRFVSGLPGPAKQAATVAAVLAAGVALTGGAALVAVPKIAAFQAAVAGLEAGALKTAGTRLASLGSALAGPWGIGLAVATVAVGLFAAKQGEAARKVDDLASTLDTQTGALTANSREWMIKELVESGAMGRAKSLGMDLAVVTDAALGNADALAQLNAELDAMGGGRKKDGVFDGLTKEGMSAGIEVETLRGRVEELATTSEKAAAKGRLAAEATRAGGGAAKENAEKQKALTGAWAAGAEEGTSLADSADALKKSFDALSGGFLDEREASRQVRSSLRDIREAMAEYAKEHGSLDGAFRKGTKSGDEFAGMLDGLASDYQSKIAATVEAGASEEKVAATYEASRKKLAKVAEQMGMSKDAARAYVDQVLAIPEMVATEAKFDTAEALAAASYLETALDRAARDRVAYIHPTVGAIQKSGGKTLREADGGVVSFYGNGGVESHVAQIAPAGAWRVWAEPETGGEAYIPLSPAKRARSLDIWSETGRRLGVEGFASGGFSGAVATVAANPGDWIRYIAQLAKAATSLASSEKKLTKAEGRADRASDRVSDATSALRDARADRPSRLDVLQQRGEVRDIRKSLHATGKDRLTGLDREIAKAQLKEAEAELKAMRASEKVIKSAKKDLARAKAEAQKETKALQAAQKAVEEAQAAADRAAARQERADDVSSQGDLFGGSAARGSRTLDRLIRDVSDYTTVYSQLKAAGASAWLLGQIDGEAQRGNYRAAIRFGRGLLADRSLFVKLEGQGAQLSALGYKQQAATESVAAGRLLTVTGGGSTASPVISQPTYVTPTAPVASTAVTFNLSAISPDAITTEVMRRLTHEGVI